MKSFLLPKDQKTVATELQGGFAFAIAEKKELLQELDCVLDGTRVVDAARQNSHQKEQPLTESRSAVFTKYGKVCGLGVLINVQIGLKKTTFLKVSVYVILGKYLKTFIQIWETRQNGLLLSELMVILGIQKKTANGHQQKSKQITHLQIHQYPLAEGRKTFRSGRKSFASSQTHCSIGFAVEYQLNEPSFHQLVILGLKKCNLGNELVRFAVVYLSLGQVKLEKVLEIAALKSATPKKETKKSNGIHGQKRAWIVRKLSEIDALNITLKRLAT